MARSLAVFTFVTPLFSHSSKRVQKSLKTRTFKFLSFHIDAHSFPGTLLFSHSCAKPPVYFCKDCPESDTSASPHTEKPQDSPLHNRAKIFAGGCFRPERSARHGGVARRPLRERFDALRSFARALPLRPSQTCAGCVISIAPCFVRRTMSKERCRRVRASVDPSILGRRAPRNRTPRAFARRVRRSSNRTAANWYAPGAGTTCPVRTIFEVGGAAGQFNFQRSTAEEVGSWH